MAVQNSDNTEYLEKELLSPYNYLMKFKGKQIRSRIILAFNHWLDVPREKLHSIIRITYSAHVATLLIDDIQDDTRVRRGVPAAHCVYGLPLTINAGIHVLLLALKDIYDLSPTASKILITQGLEIARGQGLDLYWRENVMCPTEDQYKTMVGKKTARTFVLPVQLMQLFSENKTDFSELALLFGCYFQIRDDYCNVMKQEALEEWLTNDVCKEHSADNLCDDITEGKFSFPVIHAMQSPYAEEILNILRLKTRDLNLKIHCLSLLEKAGSLQYTRDVMADFDRKIRAEAVRYGGNPEMESVLNELLDWQT